MKKIKSFLGWAGIVLMSAACYYFLCVDPPEWMKSFGDWIIVGGFVIGVIILISKKEKQS